MWFQNSQNQNRTHLLGPNQNQVMARLWAGVAAAGEGEEAQLPAGGAGPRVAPVRLPGGVMAGGGAPEDTRETPADGRSSVNVKPLPLAVVYLQASLQRGGLVVLSRPHGTTSTLAPQEQRTSTVSGHG